MQRVWVEVGELVRLGPHPWQRVRALVHGCWGPGKGWEPRFRPLVHLSEWADCGDQGLTDTQVGAGG